MSDPAAIATAYGVFFEQLTRKRADELRRFVAPDVHFKDPFNEVRGADLMVRLVVKMFDDVGDPRFRMRAIAGTGATWFLRWDFDYLPPRFAGRERRSFPGVSEIRIAPESALIAAHLDHWDAAEHVYGHLPLLGPLLRLVRRPLVLRS
jgi:hypothetical protein